MPQVTLKFKLPEEDSEMKLALRAAEYQDALHRVSQEIFRPHRKHGYDNPKLQGIINANPEVCQEVIGILEDMFFEIIKELNIEL